MSVCSLPNLTLPLLLPACPSLPPLSLSPSLSYTVYRNATTQATLSVFRSRGSREGEKESIKTQSQSQSASSCAFSFMSDVKYSQEGVCGGRGGRGVPPRGTQYAEYSNWHSHSSSACCCWYSFISLTERFTLASSEVMRWVIISVVHTPLPPSVRSAVQRSNVPRVGAACPLPCCASTCLCFCCVCLAWKRFFLIALDSRPRKG